MRIVRLVCRSRLAALAGTALISALLAASPALAVGPPVISNISAHEVGPKRTTLNIEMSSGSAVTNYTVDVFLSDCRHGASPCLLEERSPIVFGGTVFPSGRSYRLITRSVAEGLGWISSVAVVASNRFGTTRRVESYAELAAVPSRD